MLRAAAARVTEGGWVSLFMLPEILRKALEGWGLKATPPLLYLTTTN